MENTKSPNIEFYYRDGCIFCMRAKQLLQDKQLLFKEYNAGSAPQLFNEMQERSNGGKTYPQIFIDGKHIGGCDDLYALEAAGELDKLVK